MINVTNYSQRPPAHELAPSHPLAEAFEEQDTVIVLVVGAGADSDRAEERCRGLALDPGFESVRVVRVRDRSELPGARWSYFLGGNKPLAVIGPDRRRAMPLERADAVDLFVAVAAAA